MFVPNIVTLEQLEVLNWWERSQACKSTRNMKLTLMCCYRHLCDLVGSPIHLPRSSQMSAPCGLSITTIILSQGGSDVGTMPSPDSPWSLRISPDGHGPKVLGEERVHNDHQGGKRRPKTTCRLGFRSEPPRRATPRNRTKDGTVKGRCLGPPWSICFWTVHKIWKIDKYFLSTFSKWENDKTSTQIKCCQVTKTQEQVLGLPI